MAFKVETLKEWGSRFRASFRAETPGSDAWLWPNVWGVLAKVLAQWAYLFDRRIKTALDQAFVSKATIDYLTRHGDELGMPRKQASYPEGAVRFTGTLGTSIPAGTILTRDDGATYATDATALVPAVGYIDVAVTGQATGPSGNALADTPLVMSPAIAAITETVVDPKGIGRGSDIEGIEDYRQRLLFRKRNPPHGGSESDYEMWALSVAGVTRAWAKGNAFREGTVAVWVMMDDAYLDGIPQQADLDAVQAVFDLNKPATATAVAIAPNLDNIDITIKNLTPDTAEVRANVEAALIELFKQAPQPSLPDQPFSLRISWIWQAIANATGETSHEVTIPGGDITFATGIMPSLGNVILVRG